MFTSPVEKWPFLKTMTAISIWRIFLCIKLVMKRKVNRKKNTLEKLVQINTSLDLYLFSTFSTFDEAIRDQIWNNTTW